MTEHVHNPGHSYARIYAANYEGSKPSILAAVDALQAGTVTDADLDEAVLDLEIALSGSDNQSIELAERAVIARVATMGLF